MFKTRLFALFSIQASSLVAVVMNVRGINKLGHLKRRQNDAKKVGKEKVKPLTLLKTLSMQASSLVAVISTILIILNNRHLQPCYSHCKWDLWCSKIVRGFFIFISCRYILIKCIFPYIWILNPCVLQGSPLVADVSSGLIMSNQSLVLQRVRTLFGFSLHLYIIKIFNVIYLPFNHDFQYSFLSLYNDLLWLFTIYISF